MANNVIILLLLSCNRHHIFETSIWVYCHRQHTCGAIFHVIFLFLFFFFFQCVQPDSWSSLCDAGDQAQLHWLQPSGYLTQPLATQWLTQQLIGVLKASYLTHQNNKYCYQAGSSHASFLHRPRMSLVSWLVLVGSRHMPAFTTHAFNATMIDTQGCDVGLEQALCACKEPLGGI